MKVIPNDIVKSLSGKVCSHSDTHVTLNPWSGKMYTSKRCHPYTGPASTDQIAQRQAFATRAAYASAWLNANHPTATNPNGTAAYQEAQQIKKNLHLSNVRQVVCKYMNSSGVVTLPSGATGSTGGGGSSATNFTLTLVASPSAGGTVTGGGSYASGASANIEAIPNSGYSFTKWSDNNTNAERTVTVSSNQTLTAIFSQD